MMMQAEESHSLLSVTSRRRKASSVLPVQS